MKRVLTSLVLLPIAFYTIFFAPSALFLAVVVLLACLCYYEYSAIAAAHGIEGPLWIGYGLGALLLADVLPLRLLGAGLLAFALGLRELRQAILFGGAALLGLFYVFGAWRCAVDLRALHPNWILFALAVNWVGDVAAFYVGRAIGKHKLAPRISPGKSWEGAVASMAAAVLFAYGFYVYGGVSVALLPMLLLGVVANVAGQVGDLAESAMKRGAGMKDSGTLLPGHGGFLDRLDSSLFTMPVVYYYLASLGTINGLR